MGAACSALHFNIDLVQIAILGHFFDPNSHAGEAPAHWHDGLTAVRVHDVANARRGARRIRGQRAEPTFRLFPHRDPHVLRLQAFERQELEVIGAGELRNLRRADAHAIPGCILPGGFGKTVDLASQDAAGLEHAPRFGQIREDNLGAGDVLKNSVGVNEVEELVRIKG